jgi:hypothetical protein
VVIVIIASIQYITCCNTMNTQLNMSRYAFGIDYNYPPDRFAKVCINNKIMGTD